MNNIFIRKRGARVERGPKFQNSIAVIGDDVAFGIGDSSMIFEAPGISGKLATEISRSKNIRQSWNIYNYGYRNSSAMDWLPGSYKGKEAAVNLFESTFSRHDPQIVLILLGYNDSR